MPIVYETPAPVSAYGALGELQERASQRRAAAENAMAAAARGSGGGNSGGGGDSIQDAINNRDAMQFRQVVQNDAGNFTARDAGMVQAQHDQQISRFRLEAELSQTQLTQQENMRLQRMKNAVGEISNDPTLADDEKAALITQLRTGINPLEHRASMGKLQAEQAMKEAQAEHYQAQASLDIQRMKAMASGAEGRDTFLPDPKALAEIVADIKENHPYAGYLPDEAITEMAKQEAIRQGLGTRGIIQPDGKFEPFDRGSSRGAGASKESVGTHASGLSPQDYLKALDHANSVVQREAQMTVVGDDLQKKPVHPELADPEKRDARVKQLLKTMGLPGDFAEYGSGLQPPKTNGYQSRLKSKQQPQPARNYLRDWWLGGPRDVASGRGNEVAAAASGSGPKPPELDPEQQKPFNVLNPESMSPLQRLTVDKLYTVKRELAAASGLSESDLQGAHKLWDEAVHMLQMHGSVANMRKPGVNPGVYRHYLAVIGELDNATRKKKERPAAPASRGGVINRIFNPAPLEDNGEGYPIG